MSRRWFLSPILVTLVLAIGIPLLGNAELGNRPLITPLRKLPSFDRTIRHHAQAALQEGRDTFRFDTFGDEIFWGDTLQLHQAIAGARQGGGGEPGCNMHTPDEIGIDGFQASRAPRRSLPDFAAARALDAPEGWVLP